MKISFNNLKGDLFGGITAAIVALPLALAFGISSGLGAAAGLYGAIFVGLFAAIFGGTPTQISGPTGPMTVIMAAVFTELVAANPVNGIFMAFTVVMLAGAIQILFGILRLGKYITLVPYPVVSGFMSGIGILIIILQLLPISGHEAVGNPLEVISSIPKVIQEIDYHTLLLGVVTLLTLFLWPTRYNKVLPATLISLFIGTGILLVFFPNAEIAQIGVIPSGLPEIKWPMFDMPNLKLMLKDAFLLASLGSIDSLLTSLVADNLTSHHHNSDKELIGQGIGNIASGFFGGLPGAGATMRTVVNIKSGGNSQLSGIFHAIFLLIAVLGIGKYFSVIPHAVLAAILIKVGLDIIDWKFIKRITSIPVFSASLMLIVLFLTVFVDLITAVLVGVFIANVVTISRLTKEQSDGIIITNGIKNSENIKLSEQQTLKSLSGKVLLFRILGPISYGVGKLITQRILEFNSHKYILLDLRKTSLIGVTSAMVLEEILEKEKQLGRDIYIIANEKKLIIKTKQMSMLKDIQKSNIAKTFIESIEQIKERENIAC